MAACKNLDIEQNDERSSYLCKNFFYIILLKIMR